MRASPSSRALSAGILAGVMTLSAAPAAQAQYAYEPDLLLPPRAVVWRLNDRGFTDVTRPRFDGQAYILEASNPYGDRLRLFVDARDGRIIGRHRLDVAPYAPPRIMRRAPGYGWTEDDEAIRQPIRQAERIIPPADIPFPQDQARRARPAPAGLTDLANRSETGSRTVQPAPPGPADRNPMGLNPDARGADAKPKSETPRKVVRLTPTVKAGSPVVTPGAPKLSDVPPAGSKADAAPAAVNAAVSSPKVDGPAAAMTPASVQPPPVPKPMAQNWKDVPADAKRPVRVIGGATIVPGTTKEPEKD
ncbi:hypothetical protein ASF41_00185 [Methylobacterium sp. Leaf111]|uniref:hypothetical protein n=1 Tax=Methylobacterium sp. Leaf111 TaxID=1736257 RepID=UPI0006F91483|nr:hypothetical protein [Methylobacterium sp. Leaf111]KQP76263.1 hypothetical protein ASF41_00185 [Methylobacterium sp. Leaf111]